MNELTFLEQLENLIAEKTPLLQYKSYETSIEKLTRYYNVWLEAYKISENITFLLRDIRDNRIVFTWREWTVDGKYLYFLYNNEKRCIYSWITTNLNKRFCIKSWSHHQLKGDKKEMEFNKIVIFKLLPEVELKSLESVTIKFFNLLQLESDFQMWNDVIDQDYSDLSIKPYDTKKTHEDIFFWVLEVLSIYINFIELDKLIYRTWVRNLACVQTRKDGYRFYLQLLERNRIKLCRGSRCRKAYRLNELNVTEKTKKINDSNYKKWRDLYNYLDSIDAISDIKNRDENIWYEYYVSEKDVIFDFYSSNPNLKHSISSLLDLFSGSSSWMGVTKLKIELNSWEIIPYDCSKYYSNIRVKEV